MCDDDSQEPEKYISSIVPSAIKQAFSATSHSGNWPFLASWQQGAEIEYQANLLVGLAGKECGDTKKSGMRGAFGDNRATESRNRLIDRGNGKV